MSLTLSHLSLVTCLATRERWDKVKDIQTLETESKAKAEALRMKKKLEGDVGDLDIALEHANAGALETQSSIKKYAAQIRDAQANLEEESRQKSVAQDALVV